MSEKPWVPLTEVCEDYGFTAGSARNAIRAGRFPVPTYKAGKIIVIDRVVHKEYFERKRREGLRHLEDEGL